MRIRLSESSSELFSRSSESFQLRLDRCFEQIRRSPRRHPNIRPLKGPLKGSWRYRLGDWRIVYQIDDQREEIVITVIEKRSDVYG